MQLRGEKISFRYKKENNWILKDVDIHVNQGEIVGLSAPSGYGKTTLAKILAGYEKPTLGKVMIVDDKLSDKKYNEVQLIFQHPEKSVNPKWKMKDILQESWHPSTEFIQKFGIELEWMNRWPRELSGGELQRFCVVRALSPETKFLIADEITTMLDSITQAQIWHAILEIVNTNNIGLLVISHEKVLLDKICNRTIKLT